jgi:hypothetical protein
MTDFNNEPMLIFSLPLLGTGPTNGCTNEQLKVYKVLFANSQGTNFLPFSIGFEKNINFIEYNSG